MSSDVQRPRWIKRAGGEWVAQVGFGEFGRIRELRLDQMYTVAATGLGEAPRVLDGQGRVALKPHEDVVLRHRNDWWFVAAYDMHDALERAERTRPRRAIVIDDPSQIRALVLPANALERDAMLARLRIRSAR